MNANELADELESRMPAGYWTPPELLAEAATMLRQQQVEIEKYKIAVFAMECFRNALETSVRRTALESVWEALDNLEEK